MKGSEPVGLDHLAHLDTEILGLSELYFGEFFIKVYLTDIKRDSCFRTPGIADIVGRKPNPLNSKRNRSLKPSKKSD